MIHKSYSQSFSLYPQNDMPVEQITDKACVFAVMDNGQRVTVAVWKEPGMEWGDHATWTSCECREDQLDEDGYCSHVHSALNQIMTGVFTFNDRSDDEESEVS